MHINTEKGWITGLARYNWKCKLINNKVLSIEFCSKMLIF